MGDPSLWLLALLAGTALVSGAAGWLVSNRRHRRVARSLAALVEAAPVAITAIDGEGRVTLWNPAAERIFQWRSDEILGQPIPFVPPDLRAQHLRFRQMLDEGRAVAGVQVSRMRRDGSLVPVRLYTAPIRGPGGELEGYMGVLVDVRERIALEEQLRHGQRMQALGEFAGAMAHDFNNLLTAIMAHTEHAQGLLPPSDDAQHSLGRVLAAADRGAVLIRQLLAFGRRQVLQPRVLAPSEVLGDQVPMLRRLLGERIRLEVAGGDEVGCIRVDPPQLHQVLLNLVVNARDAIPQAGTVTLAVSGDAEWVRLTVMDDGEGMAPAIRDRIFEPFFTTKPHGSGLGLATVYGIVAQSGGRIQVESAPGRGTTFHVDLPRVEGPPDGLAPEGPKSLVSGTGTVWVVEDEADLLEVAAETLIHAGYQVVAVPSAEDLLLRLEAEDQPRPPDLLVTDVVLPGRNGRQLADALRERWPGIRVLFISGYSGEVLGNRGIIDESVDLLEKPYRPTVLAERVRRALGRPTA